MTMARRVAWTLEPLLLAVLLGLVSIVPVAWALQASPGSHAMEEVGWRPLGTEQALRLAIGSVVPASLLGGAIGALLWRLRPTVAPAIALGVAWTTGLVALPLVAAAAAIPLREGVYCIDACFALLRDDDPLSGLAVNGQFLLAFIFSIPFLVVPAGIFLIARAYRHRAFWMAAWLSTHAAIHAFALLSGAWRVYAVLLLGVVVWTAWLVGRDAGHAAFRSVARRWAIAIALGAIAIAVPLGSMWGAWIPSVPEHTPEILVGTVTLHGFNPPDPSQPLAEPIMPPTPSGAGCFEPVVRPAGRLDLCWEGHRDNREVLPGGDIYHFRLTATLHSVNPTSWVTIVIVVPNDEHTLIRQIWPEGVLGGPCRIASVEGMNFLTDGSATHDEVDDVACGRTTARRTDGWRRHSVIWTCAACGATDPSGRQIAVRELVGTRQGSVPTWAVYAELGG